MARRKSWDQVLEVRYLPEASHDMSCTRFRHFVVLFVGWFFFILFCPQKSIHAIESHSLDFLIGSLFFCNLVTSVV